MVHVRLSAMFGLHYDWILEPDPEASTFSASTSNKMWELYEDDESFQRMGKGKGAKCHEKGHDAKLLAKVLYGKKVPQISENAIREKHVNQNEKKKVA